VVFSTFTGVFYYRSGGLYRLRQRVLSFVSGVVADGFVLMFSSQTIRVGSPFSRWFSGPVVGVPAVVVGSVQAISLCGCGG
jgi:hypothetical protein